MCNHKGQLDLDRPHLLFVFTTYTQMTIHVIVKFYGLLF